MKIRVRYRDNAGEVTANAARIFRISMTVLAMTTVALLSALITMRLAIHTGEVEVPDLSGLTVAEAADKSTGARLNLTIENRFYSTTVPAGRVLSQSPAAGAVVRKGWHMRITESIGPQHVAIPDTVGMNEHDAGAAIRRASLDLGALAYLPSPGPPGTVLAQTPPADADGVDKPEIGLLLSQSQASAPTAYVMPNLAGMSYSAANAKMREMDLHVWAIVPQQAAPAADASAPAGTVAAAPVSLVPAGVVVSQVPPAGMRVSSADNPHVKMSAGAPASSASTGTTTTPVTTPGQSAIPKPATPTAPGPATPATPRPLVPTFPRPAPVIRVPPA
jgi:beta-lactam-binding protein with PASTA domain